MSARSPRAFGLLLAATFALAAADTPANAAESYTHDAIGRLTDVAYQNGGSLHYTYDANGNILSVVTSLATAVGDGAPAFQFALGPATPNPGSGRRDLVFSIPANGHVTLRVFDVQGRQVAKLLDRDLTAGRYGARFTTERWGAGVYYYRLQMGARSRRGRMVVLR